MSKENYCSECGEPTVPSKFNVTTGEKTVGIRCENPKCWLGCYNTGGHDYKGFFSKRRCARCGTYPHGD